MTAKITGGCACGAVRYQSDADPDGGAVCHCLDCQKASGTPFAANVFLQRGALEITGELKGYTVTGDSGKTVTRRFCPSCGTLVALDIEVSPDTAIVTVGSLDDASWFRPGMEFWTDRRHPWVEIQSERKSFPQNPGPPPE